MRDRLSVGKMPEAGDPISPPFGTMVLGFESDSLHMQAAGVAEAPFFRYGPFPILELAQNVDRVVLEALTVTGNPPGHFVNRCWWTLQLERGPLQEFLAISRETSPVPLTDPLNTAGVRHTDFGSHTWPQRVDIQLAQGGLLQLVVLSLENRPLTFYTRTTGKQYSRVAE